MSMIACHECTTPISTEAVKCPRCGCTPPWSGGFTIGFWLIVAFFIIMFAVAGSVGGHAG